MGLSHSPQQPIWCEHCRDHFGTDHYPNDTHGVGEEFGPYGRLLAASALLDQVAGALITLWEIGPYEAWGDDADAAARAAVDAYAEFKRAEA